MRCGADLSRVGANQFVWAASTLRRVETEIELLGRLRSGDEQAFAIVVERYQIPMLRLANSMVSNRSVAEEAVQDTWMGVVRGIEKFEGRSSLKTWLFHILVNRVRTARAVEEKRRVDRLPSVDPSRFDGSGQWAQPVQPWDEEVEERLDASAFVPTLPRRWTFCRRASVRSCSSATSKASRATRPVMCSASSRATRGSSFIALGAGLRNRLAAEMGMA